MGGDFYKSVPDEYFKREEYEAYELEKFDRESLDEIKEFLRKDKYTDRETIQEHLEYLEQLANKVQQNITAEKSEGEVTWELEHDLTEIKDIFGHVEMIFDKYFRTK